ncbi:MAG: hypothetical protein LQ342_004160 [Letrouitia transgressa]|nr:MAG: hypothetical protein LQ342_004160 [Letrouitia transgressa]
MYVETADSNTSSELILDEPKGDDWWELRHWLSKTHPLNQFLLQESEKNWELLPMTNPIKNSFPGTKPIIESWVSRGIWDDDWTNEHQPGHRWKHEHIEVPPIPEDANFEEVVKHARKIRDVNASRPINMFFYDWLEEVKKTVQKKGREYTLESELTKMVESSYQVVKDRWKRHEKWTKEWELLPGDQWRHETTYLGPEPKHELKLEGTDSDASTVAG